uniref:Uncharacterized protein n=1 Tax=Populus trichocarpa TaxID=3694 RepID=A0A2K1YSD7_POPTR
MPSWIVTHCVFNIQKHMHFEDLNLISFEFLCGYGWLPGTHQNCAFLFPLQVLILKRYRSMISEHKDSTKAIIF